MVAPWDNDNLRTDMETELQNQWKIEDKEALGRLIETPDGLNFICRLLCECGMFNCSARSNSPHDTAFFEGKRSVGLWILNNLEESKRGHAACVLEKIGIAGRLLGKVIRIRNDKKIQMEAFRNGR